MVNSSQSNTIFIMKSKHSIVFTGSLLLLLISFSCKNNSKNESSRTPVNTISTPPPKGMVWVPSKTFIQGAKDGDPFAMPREKPGHLVQVDGFFIDVTEVTNAQFRTFVDSTSYKTVAERAIDWDLMKTQLPPNTAKPHDSILQPGSMIFNKNVNAVQDMNNYIQWWTWKIGADWKHPAGPQSNIDGKDSFPVVHVALEDALAYCKWANRRLPTETEWEAAAQGYYDESIYTWGDNSDVLNQNSNTWQGVFPVKNNSEDGFELIAPVRSFPANSIGLYDMLGNVWELTNDLFNLNYYNEIDAKSVQNNPKGSDRYYNPNNPYETEYVMKGGSFLCHESYCASFRISARMGTSKDSGSDHIGFRTVATKAMLKTKH